MAHCILWFQWCTQVVQHLLQKNEISAAIYGVRLSDCQTTVGLSDGWQTGQTVADSARTCYHRLCCQILSDTCRTTVGHCRITVGFLSDYCRTTVGLLSDCCRTLSDQGSATSRGRQGGGFGRERVEPSGAVSALERLHGTAGCEQHG